MTNIPAELAYTAEHEWVQDLNDDSTFKVGITDHAQSELGEVVFVQLPEVGDSVTAGDVVGEIESTKSVSDIYAPVTGTVRARNEDLDGEPGSVNSAPYEAGWLLEITLSDPSEMDALLDAAGYREQVG